jgi:hypothetical protein
LGTASLITQAVVKAEGGLTWAGRTDARDLGGARKAA